MSNTLNVFSHGRITKSVRAVSAVAILATNLMASSHSDAPLIKQDPQVILFPVGDDEGIPDQEQQRWLRWTTLSAVKQNRFVRIPSVLLDRPGPRVVDGLELLARQLHPDLFPSGGAR